jgi:4-amino-4-deoxy-L-arabinose transferase-like glycosyltransferase
VGLARRPWFVIALFTLLVVATRCPLAPGQLFTFDDVNLAYSIGHFDIRMSQPHPPGYPLFVMEMRVLSWLHFRRAESILLTLALLGSLTALLLVYYCGNRILGADSGFWAAWILVLHPVFWHSGVTSALRVQLAIVSLAVGACCWNAWRGDPRWVTWSALAIGIGAGIRPETGPLLFPLWAACALRAPLSWRERGKALSVMAATVLVWLLPAMLASGGPLSFIRANLDYVSDQASVSSGLFGASDSRWRTSVTQLLVWTFCGVTAWTLPAVLAWRRYLWWNLGWNRISFLALWMLPSLIFAIVVHVEDPGHTLAMVPVVPLVGGYLVNRALAMSDAWVSRWLVVSISLATWAFIRIFERQQDLLSLQWLPVLCLALGLAMKVAETKNLNYLPRTVRIVFMLFPILFINYTYFHHHGWYFKGAATTGYDAFREQTWADINSAFALTSLDQISATLAVDDHTLQETRHLIAERLGKTVVIWKGGLTAWRKVAYYSPAVEIAVLEHKKIRSGSPPVIAIWKGAKLERRLTAGTPLQLPAGTRIVWLLNPRTDFLSVVQQNFPVVQAGPVYTTDLPAESGSRRLGEYQLVW